MVERTERRREARIGVRLDVRFENARDAARALNAYSVNFSSGGMCVRTQGTYAVGEEVTLSMRIENELFELNGVVAWSRSSAIGIRFVNVNPADKARLMSVAKTLTAINPA